MTKNLVRFLLLCAILFSSIGVHPAQAAAPLAADEPPVRLLLILSSSGGALDARSLDGLQRSQRQRKVIETLRSKAIRAQAPALQQLERLSSSGEVETVQPLWINNTIAVTAPASAVEELARLPGVQQVIPDPPVVLTGPTTVGTSGAGADPSNNPAVTAAQAASPLWKMGYRGQGIVVANVDSGVSLANTDLAAKWRGGSNSWLDLHNQHATPYDTDLTGHGTATMGIMVSSAYGVAPDAQWIAVKLFDDAGNASLSDVYAGFQWLLDPDGNPATADAPDVVNNSWTVGQQGCMNIPELHQALQALLNAGILPVFAAGNFGPGEGSGPTPSVYPEVLAVGALASDNQIAYFSSHGPTDCRAAGTVYPDLSAPGVGVVSSGTTDSYPASNLDGTSFSAPFVAGTLALILNAFPDLTPQQQRQVLIASAEDLGPSGPDTTFGYGKLNPNQSYRYAVQITVGEYSNHIYLPSVSAP